MDGPVISDERKALESQNVNLVLAWVQKSGEAEINAAFERTLAVRKLSAEAAELADTYFFETLVRVHRAGEGVPYTGLKSVVVDPALAAADAALAAAEVETLAHMISETMQNGIEARFHQAIHVKPSDPSDVEAGRLYVRAYVEFIHYVEGLFKAAEAAGEHSHEAAPAHHEGE
jgi:hypothetical protein